MSSFTSTFFDKFASNLNSNFSSQGGLSVAYSGFVNVTNIAAGSTPAGKIVQLYRNIEATAVSAAAGSTSPNWSGVVNAAAGLAVAGAFIAWAPLTLPAALLGTALPSCLRLVAKEHWLKSQAFISRA
jgi:hypothetical protein